MKNFFDTKNLAALVDRVLEHGLFKPISISIVASFLLINGFAYFKDYIDQKHETRASKQKLIPIKVKIPHSGNGYDLGEDQVLEYRIKPGDTILKVLFNLGTPETDVFSILTEMKKIYNPGAIHAGQKVLVKYQVKISYKKEGDNNEDVISRDIIVNSVAVAPEPEEEIIITRNKDASYTAKKEVRQLTKYVMKYSGTIRNGLFVDGDNMGISSNIMMNMINLYSFDVDFQRDIKSGDKFEILFESFYDADGKKVKDGNILFSSLELSKRSIDIYMNKVDSNIEYFDANGNSVRKSLLRTPINGARISSGFGMRRHPILGYSRMHKGLDFAAHMGTPILAAGNGVISYYGKKGGYGNYVAIKHNADYSTAYGHASKFVSKLRVGSKVRQGQVVAYVGSTGRSTGPHLHYEIIYKGSAINPGKVRTVSGVKLSGRELAKFNLIKSEIEKTRKNTPNQNSKI